MARTVKYEMSDGRIFSVSPDEESILMAEWDGKGDPFAFLQERGRPQTGFTNGIGPVVDEWAAEREDVLRRFSEELRKATGDGSKKRQSGLKPAWYEDTSHEGAIFSHLTKWKRGEKVDPDSGAHPLVHAAWRCMAIACSESGNVPKKEKS